MSRDNEEHRGLTPERLSHAHLPEQKMYKVRAEEASSVEQVEGQVRAYPLFTTNDLVLLYFEMGPSGMIDWHTHVPNMDEVSMCLEGRARYTLEREDGSHQTIEVGPMEFVYLPGGARNKIETVGEQVHKGMVIHRPVSVARLENLEDFTPSDGDDWPMALWIDRKRDEVLEKDEDAVST
ncbi:cupin domain-containing protein [Halocatena marina]|uniref:Cupin domain-containing protein n=2 Tax=Halocatena marina TaxID=2934937 RepID=A0ABD5YNI8_9EURY